MKEQFAKALAELIRQWSADLTGVEIREVLEQAARNERAKALQGGDGERTKGERALDNLMGDDCA